MKHLQWLSVMGALVLSTSALAHSQGERTSISAVISAPVVAQYGPPGQYVSHSAHNRHGHKKWRHHARKERHLKRKIRRLRHKLAHERARNAYHDAYYDAPRIVYRDRYYGSGLNLQYHDDAGSYQLRYRTN